MAKATTTTRTRKPKATDARPAKRKLPQKTKKEHLIAMLRSDGGADVTQISRKLGWLPHTTRAALTGLRKAGYGIAVEKPETGGAGRYRITGAPDGAAPA